MSKRKKKKTDLNETKDEPERLRQTLLRIEEDRDTWRRRFQDCSKKQREEIERLRQEYKERSERLGLDEMMSEEQGPSGSGRNRERDEKEGEDRQPEEEMKQDSDQAGKDDDKASTGGLLNLDFNFWDYEVGAEMLDGATEPAEDGTCGRAALLVILKPPKRNFYLCLRVEEE